ncbi:hypothetical protein AB0442_06840 [Kitasatospora sp. NPDC085895]|uniref:hypothetical protein n=1 Tax=Kitasatospora sp. NPDC085895 TaxID=3155057 RepID=UPI00344D4C40
MTTHCSGTPCAARPPPPATAPCWTWPHSCRPRTAEQLRWSRSTVRALASQALTGRDVPWRRREAVLFAVDRAEDPGSRLLADATADDA